MFDEEKVCQFYQNLLSTLNKVKEAVQKPLTFTEKIWYLHTINQEYKALVSGQSLEEILPDRVALEDKSAQMALLQLAALKQKKMKIPTAVYCDRLISAEEGNKKDIDRANNDKREIFDSLRKICSRHGIGFWAPGSGIAHQIILENYAFPGGLIVGTDFHASSAGGLGMMALSVCGNDAIAMAAGIPWELEFPQVIGICLKGHLSGWASPKDLIIKISELLALDPERETILEYFGEGAKTISCTGKGTICSMGSSLGAMASLFPYDEAMKAHLDATGHATIVKLIEPIKESLAADPGVMENPTKYYDQVIEINLSELEPYIKGPPGHDSHIWPLSEFVHSIRIHGYPEKLSAALIGSCINSSYEDFQKVSSILMQVLKHGFKIQCPLLITIASKQLEATLRRDGLLKPLEMAGAFFLANACGPCSGQWKRHDVTFGEKNAIMTSYNSSLFGHYDGNPGTHSFVASPEIVAAFAVAGSLTFNPLTDILINDQGLPIKLVPPSVEKLPLQGYVIDHAGYFPPEKDLNVEDSIESSDHPSKFSDFLIPLVEKDFVDLRVLLKTPSTCSKEDFSHDGKWLKSRKLLDYSFDHMFSTTPNHFREAVGKAKNLLTNKLEPFSKVADHYKKEAIGWVIIGGQNYGEGASSELTAMIPRYSGAKAVIAKSFARSHEIHLKKQGLLTLAFACPDDYEKIREDDFLDIKGMHDFKSGSFLKLLIRHADGKIETVPLVHSYNAPQIEWFKAGSALNSLKL